MKNNLTKTQSERRHAKKRAFERYGLVLNKFDFQTIILRIQTNKAKFIERQTNRITIWELTVHDILCRVVYDKQRKQIVSFLPLEAKEIT